MSLTSVLILSLVLMALAPFGAHQATAAPAATKSGPALFSQGREVFTVRNTAGKTPEFRVLNGTPSERALALALITTLNAHPETDPKIPVRDFVELKVETITLTPLKTDPTQLTVGVQVSGHELLLPKTVSRAEFLLGQPIELKFPSEERAVSLFSVQSGGHLRFRLIPGTNEMQIQDALGQMEFESPLAGNGSEVIRFSGRGIRRL